MDSKKEVGRLQKKVSKWLKWWVGEQYFVESHCDDPNKYFSAYLNGSEDALLLGNRTQECTFWHIVHYEHAVLNEGGDGLADLALAVRYAEAYVRFEEAYANAGQNGSVLLTEAALYFALAVLAGQKEIAGRIGKTLFNGLDNSLLDLRHTERHRKGVLFRHFWFLMHLYEHVSGDHFDIKNYSYPPDMSPYAEILVDWKTPDLTKVHNWVCAMADFHIQETRNTAHDEIDEFDSESTMLFPYEILCWLRLREWVGLENPETFEHPLMQQPLAKLPSPVPLPTPETPLLDQVIAKFKQEYPNSFV